MPEQKPSAHKQRIEDVFAGRKPDRIPLCEQAFASSVASEILGYEAYTGSTDIHYYEACAWLEGGSAHDEFIEKCYEDVIALHKKLDFDILFLPWLMGGKPAERLDDSRLLYTDGGGYRAVYKFDSGSRTYGVEQSTDRFDSYEQVEAYIRDFLKTWRPAETAGINPLLQRALDEYGGEFEVSGFSGLAVPMQAGWLEAVAVDPELVSAYLDIRVEEQLRELEAQHKAGIKLINGGGDFAFNAGPVYSPAFFEKVMAPKWKMFFDKCHELGMAYIFRSDGNLWSVADSLFENGLADAYYEVDYDADMRFEDLRKRYPELVLFGNVSCGLLHSGTAEQVKERTLECIRAAYPRVVLGSSNAILHGSPVENVLAVYEAVKSFKLL